MVLATQPEKAAFKAGLEAGDKIIKNRRQSFRVGDQAVSSLVKEIQNSSEKSISLVINRGGSSKI